MKRFLGLSIGLFAVIGFNSLAEAITITTAEVRNGEAVVRGNKAAKSAIITWDGLSVAQTNRGGTFSFWAPVPWDCVGTLSDGTSTIEVVVLDCTPVSAARPARTRIVNGGFETGDLTGWSTIGDVSVVDSSFGVTAPEGTFQALITTAPAPVSWNPDNLVSFSGNNAVDNGLQFLFEASPGSPLSLGLSAAGIFEQSGIKQTFTIKTPAVLMFRWKYFTDEFTAERDGKVFVTDVPIFVLDETVFSLMPEWVPMEDGSYSAPWIGGRPALTGSSPTILLTETDYRMAAVQIGPGTHTFGFGIGEESDTYVTSALVVDNIVLLGPSRGVN